MVYLGEVQELDVVLVLGQVLESVHDDEALLSHEKLHLLHFQELQHLKHHQHQYHLLHKNSSNYINSYLLFIISHLSFVLELLTEDKVELASTLLILASVPNLVETISPVDTHQTDHWQEDTYTDTGTTLHAEWIELLGVIPCITSLYEGQTINSGITQKERITEFQ